MVARRQLGRSRWIALTAVLALAGAGTVACASGRDRDPQPGPAGASAAKPGWRVLPAGPLARTEVGAGRVGGSIYVVGGFAAPDGQTTAEAAAYGIRSGRWRPATPMPVAVNHPAVAVHRGFLYVHGGYAYQSEAVPETDALQRFDPRTGQWSLLAPSGLPRAAHTMAVVGGRLFAIGGVNSAAGPLRTVQVYRPGSDSWSPARAMGVAREHLASAVVGRTIFVLGGRANGRNLGVVEALDARAGRWKRLPSLRTPRSGFGAVAVKRHVIAAGGEELAEGSATIAQVEIYDPRSRRWSRLPRMITPRHGLGLVAAGRRVFALEGGPTPGLSFSGRLEMLSVAKRKLRATPSAALGPGP